MSEGSPLSRVIRRIDLSAAPPRLDSTDRLIFFDAKARVPLVKRPLLTLGKDVRQYLVSLRKPAECRGPVCRLKSVRIGLSFDIVISYEAHCEPGDEERLVTALHRTDPPALALEQIIANFVQDFVGDCKKAGRDACLEFPRIRRELADSIERRVRDEVGLTLEDVDIRPALEGKLEPITLQKAKFPVRISDCDEEIDIELTTRIDVDPDNKALALARLPETAGLEGVVKEAMREAVKGENLHALAFESTGRLRARLIETINGRLKEEGRRISHLQIDHKLTPPPREPRELKHTVKCLIGDSEEEVQHTVLLSLNDFGRFRAAGIESLEMWAQTKLADITRAVLFGKRYIDVLLDFESGESQTVREIKAWMEREAAEIGYGIRQLVVAPQLEALRWRDDFTFDDGETALPYATRDSRVKIRLNTVVHGKLSNLHDPRLSRFLTPRSTIFDETREVIRREAQQILHGIDPERFYMRFSHSAVAGEPPVQEMLEERIGRAVAERFAVEEIRVFAKQLETEVTKRLAALQERPHVLEVKSFPLRSGGRREEVTYRIIFDVFGVDENGWHVFQSKSFRTREDEIGQIEEILREDVRGVLDTVPSEYLQYSDINVKRQLEGILKSTIRKITETFGLVISIVSMRREATLGESAEIAVLTGDIEINKGSALEAAGKSSRAKLDQLEMLEKKEIELLQMGSGDEDPELQQVRRNLKTLRSDLLAYPSKADKRHVKSLPQGDAATFSFEQYGPAALSPGGAPPKQITEVAEES